MLIVDSGPAGLLWIVLAAAATLAAASSLVLDHRLHRHRHRRVPSPRYNLHSRRLRAVSRPSRPPILCGT